MHFSLQSSKSTASIPDRSAGGVFRLADGLQAPPLASFALYDPPPAVFPLSGFGTEGKRHLLFFWIPLFSSVMWSSPVSPSRLCQEEVCVDILKAYVSLLIQDQQTELVASYVSQLPAEAATAQYATFLETVDQPELRPRCLQLAMDAGKVTGLGEQFKGGS